MTKEIAIHNLFALKLRSRVTSDREALDMAIKALEQTRWIPCSEGLPDTDDKVLCWYEYYHWSREKVLPEYGIGCYLRETSAWFGEVANGKDVKVIAWMRLPKGYEPEQVQPHMMCEED